MDTTELRRLLAEATPLPWHHSDDDLWGCITTEPKGRGREVALVGSASRIAQQKADVHFIAAAVNALPSLLDAAERALAAERERCATLARTWPDTHPRAALDVLFSDLADAIRRPRHPGPGDEVSAHRGRAAAGIPCPPTCRTCARKEVARWANEDAFAAGFEAGVEEAARVAESYEPRCDSCPRGVATAIRALARGAHEPLT